MSIDEEPVVDQGDGPTDGGWNYSPSKLYGWLVGLAFSIFGGLLCSIPVGTIVGIPVVVFGLFLCMSFSISMSSTSVPFRIDLPLAFLGLALMVFGRFYAPIDQVIESFRENRTLVKDISFARAFAIPMMLVGVHVIQMVLPWARSTRRLGFARSVISIGLLQAASVGLLVGMVMTTQSPRLGSQPYWFWIVTPLLFGLGVWMRGCWFWFAPVLVLVLTALAMPLTWYLLTQHIY